MKWVLFSKCVAAGFPRPKAWHPLFHREGLGLVVAGQVQLEACAAHALRFARATALELCYRSCALLATSSLARGGMSRAGRASVARANAETIHLVRRTTGEVAAAQAQTAP
mgnify:CR=1 FL=1